MLKLERLIGGMVLVLAFLAGHQVALKAQCSQCYENPGPAGTLSYFYDAYNCPCTPSIKCVHSWCQWCFGGIFMHKQCGGPAHCIGCY